MRRVFLPSFCLVFFTVLLSSVISPLSVRRTHARNSSALPNIFPYFHMYTLSLFHISNFPTFSHCILENCSTTSHQSVFLLINLLYHPFTFSSPPSWNVLLTPSLPLHSPEIPLAQTPRSPMAHGTLRKLSTSCTRKCKTTSSTSSVLMTMWARRLIRRGCCGLLGTWSMDDRHLRGGDPNSRRRVRSGWRSVTYRARRVRARLRGQGC